MANDLIRYDLLVQEALCGVVSRVLADVARHGLPGDHHFYITFRTHAPGVRLSSRMREQYPDEMTIILQHQFDDLKVSDHNFEVGLSFKGIPEILLIPFDALTGFFDPSVQFSLKFEPQAEEDVEAEAAKPEPVKSTPVATLPQPARTQAAKSQSAKSQPAKTQTGTSQPATIGLPAPVPIPAPAPMPVKIDAPRQGAVAGAEGSGQSAKVAEEAKVVSIDAFRKKP